MTQQIITTGNQNTDAHQHTSQSTERYLTNEDNECGSPSNPQRNKLLNEPRRKLLTE